MTLINKILIGAGGAVALAIVGVMVWLLVANAHLKARLVEAQARGNACALANGEFAQQVVRQNAAIERLKEQSAVREKRAAEAFGKAKDAARKYLGAAERIRAAKADGSACQKAEALFREYLGDVR